MPRFAVVLPFLLTAFLVQAAGAQDGYVYSDAPLRVVLADIRERSNYHFLYRDALIAGKKVSFESDADRVLDALNGALVPVGLGLRVDVARNQVLLVEAGEPRGRAGPVVRGVVVDDEHGGRLPFASVTWKAEGRLRGTAADETGAFTLRLNPQEEVELTISYIGYRPTSVRLDPARSVDSVPVRLVPETSFGPEVVVSTAALQTEIDTAWHHLLQAGAYAPIGESGVLRSLQTLPSVALSPAAASGLNVRGSRTDGFQVLLDGMSIYNQTHLFGLFDAFNEDVLQAVGLFYGVAPASLQGPPGGTLSFVTRTGSQTAMRGAAGLSNTSGKATVEGPLLGGRGSWLLSGRRSYLNAIGWFDNDALVGLGLDVGRETDVPTGPVREIPVSALTAGDASARFYDAHGKLFLEWARGARLTLNGYVGGDETLHDAERLVGDPPSREPVLVPADTRNDWSNAAASVRLHAPVGHRAYSRSTVGFSRYRSEFAKDDFVYTDPTRSLLVPTDTSRHVIRPFRNENELLEVKLAQELDLSTGDTWSAGYAVHLYRVEYQEASALRARFGGTQRSAQLDLFGQYDGKPSHEIALLAGVRSHTFQTGRFFRLSPRFRVRLFPNRRVSIGGGYSRNHQFIHRLYVEQSTNADIWVMSTPAQPPGRVDHLTAGLYMGAAPGLFLQVEGYRKRFANLREHEASAARRRLRPVSPLLDPWLHDNEGLARGLEVMIRSELGPMLWTNSYTLSRMDLRNPRVNDGAWYPADWDRRHQATSHLRVTISSGLQLHVAWALASGAPNALAHADAREPSRLSPYRRLDAGVQLRHAVGGGIFAMKVAIFNLLDRDNTWYRRPIPVVARSPDGRRVGLMNVDVYDLGVRPSFEVGYRF